jgi:hypothetical protein
VFTQDTRSLPAEAGSVSWVEYLQDLHRAHSDELALVVCVVGDVCRVNNQRLTRANYGYAFAFLLSFQTSLVDCISPTASEAMLGDLSFLLESEPNTLERRIESYLNP